MKKKIVLSIAALSIAGLITGCGGGGGSSSSNETTASTTTETQTSAKSVKVVDGYVIGANVCDANNVCATTDNNGTAIAKFADTVLTSKGGYIDVNGNNQIDDNDIALPDNFTLKTVAGKSVISPITDLIANGANPAKLAEILGIDENELYNDPIATNNIELAKAIQIVYALKAENKEDAFIQKINNFTFESTPNTDLPTFDETKETKTTTQEETNSTPATTDLPPMKVATTDLPTFDETSSVTNSNNEENTTNKDTASSNQMSGSLETFANLALSVASNEAKTLITAIMNSTASTPLALEESIANVKKELLTSPTNNTQETETVENTTTQTTEKNPATQETNTTQETTTTETNSNTQSTANTDLPPF